MKQFLILYFLVLAVLKAQAQVFSMHDPNQSKLKFVNIIQENKNMNVTTYEYMYNGAGIAVGDINNDGWNDILLVGNDYSAEIETGRMDAGKGLWILNQNGTRFQTANQCELIIKGGVKTVQPIHIHGKKHYMVGKNSGKLEILEIRK